MKYSALALEFLGVMTAWFAGYQFSLPTAADPAKGDFRSSDLSLLLFGLAIVLMVAGAVLLAAYWSRHGKTTVALHE